MERREVNWVRPSSLIHSSVVLNIAVYDRGGGGVGRRRRRMREMMIGDRRSEH